MLKHLDLFSGIGGFSLGLERTGGFETVAFCEIDPFCQKVLKKHWPHVPIYDDVRSLEHDGPVDLISGGYPCQPFSAAGKRQGTEDDRHLWPAMFSLIKKYRPRWVIGENVAGHISMGLDDVLTDLESQDYGCRVFVIPACAVDAPHRRDRVWIVANNDSKCRGTSRASKTQERTAIKITAASEQSKFVADSNSKSGTFGGNDKTNEKKGSGGRGYEGRGGGNDRRKPRSSQNGKDDVGNTQNVRCRSGKNSGRKGKENQQEQRSGVRGKSSRSGKNVADTSNEGLQRNEQRQTFSENAGPSRSTSECCEDDWACRWPTEPSVGRVANGIPSRVDRLKSLGNAVVPQIPEIIGYAILEAEK